MHLAVISDRLEVVVIAGFPSTTRQMQIVVVLLCCIKTAYFNALLNLNIML